MAESMAQAVSVGQAFPVHNKGWPGVGGVDRELGSLVALPSCDEAKLVVLQEGSTAPWGNFGCDDLGSGFFVCLFFHYHSDSRLCSFPAALHTLPRPPALIHQRQHRKSIGGISNISRGIFQGTCTNI